MIFASNKRLLDIRVLAAPDVKYSLYFRSFLVGEIGKFRNFGERMDKVHFDEMTNCINHLAAEGVKLSKIVIHNKNEISSKMGLKSIWSFPSYNPTGTLSSKP